MREGIKIDELSAIIITVICLGIMPLANSGQVIAAGSPVTLIPFLGQIALVYLFICLAARKFDDVMGKYHKKRKENPTGSSKHE